MNIAVCIKQVPLSTKIEVDPDTGTLIREGTETQINPYDEYAIEEALKVKEKIGGTVSVYTMGPPQAEDILKDALAMGADKAYLLTDLKFAGADTLATSYTLSKALSLNKIPDLIICGKQAIDGDTAQVGPSISQLLKTSLSTSVQKILEITRDSIIVEQMMDNGFHIVQLKLPSLITVVKGINTPRIATLSKRIKAINTDVEILNARKVEANISRCGLKGSPTRVFKSFSPKLNKSTQILKGNHLTVANELLSILAPFTQESAK